MNRKLKTMKLENQNSRNHENWNYKIVKSEYNTAKPEQ